MGHYTSKQQQMTDDKQMVTNTEKQQQQQQLSNTSISTVNATSKYSGILSSLSNSNSNVIHSNSSSTSSKPHKHSKSSTNNKKQSKKSELKSGATSKSKYKKQRNDADDDDDDDNNSSSSHPLNCERNHCDSNNCSAGSVVITIRLLKMETTKESDGFEQSINNDDVHAVDISNNNCSMQHISNVFANQSANSEVNSLHGTNHCILDNNSENIETNDENNKTILNKLSESAVNSQNCVVVCRCTENRINMGANQTINNNGIVRNSLNESTTAGTTPLNNCVNSDKNQLNNNNTCNFSNDDEHDNSSKIYKQNNCALLSEAVICDKKQNTSASQSEATPTAATNMSSNMTSVGNTIPTSRIMPLSHITTNNGRFTTATKNNGISIASDQTHIDKQTMEATRNFISSNIINNVSPYPHHIPFANIVHPDCVNTTSTDEHTAHCPHNTKINRNDCNKHNSTKDGAKESKTKKPNWIKFNCPKLKSIKSMSTSSSSDLPILSLTTPDTPSKTSSGSASSSTVSSPQPASFVLDKCNSTIFGATGGNVILLMDQRPLDFSRFNADEFSMDDCDKKARLQRAMEIAEGVEPPPNFTPLHSVSASSLQLLPNSKPAPIPADCPPIGNSALPIPNAQFLRFVWPNITMHQPEEMPRIHSQVDYMHCLVPDLMQITNCSFYWGKMDRYEAERLLENKPEGTFLLRDSAQEEFLFSVSFRKYGRSLHARIEQFNHKFSFDCHDPGVYTSSTVTGLLEHYKDPACVMFFEPALTLPLNRNFVFSLQQLCRATIVSHTTYDGINQICLPKKLNLYLKEYHYKQRVRVKKLDENIYASS